MKIGWVWKIENYLATAIIHYTKLYVTNKFKNKSARFANLNASFAAISSRYQFLKFFAFFYQ